LGRKVFAFFWGAYILGGGEPSGELDDGIGISDTTAAEDSGAGRLPLDFASVGSFFMGSAFFAMFFPIFFLGTFFSGREDGSRIGISSSTNEALGCVPGLVFV
jgi:hypothetical protein